MRSRPRCTRRPRCFCSGAITSFSMRDPSDLDATDLAMALIAVSDQILAIDPMYCRMVSRVDMAACVENDGLVPITSQSYPGAPNLRNRGSGAQTGEATQRRCVLCGVCELHEFAVRAVQAAIQAPADTPAGPTLARSYPERSAGRHRLSRRARGRRSALARRHGELLRRPAAFRLPRRRQPGLYFGTGTGGWEPLWATGTDGSSPGFVIMQADGNLVMYDRRGDPVWSSDTFRSGSWLAVQNDGNVVIYSPGGSPQWSTDTFVD